ncbi:MAG: SDR family oxidoreductase [Treponema sp.]|jgi:NAD(P)-dependent dehydrogenase (short-subunit alcohol dehydrogenase family)|nr:SDR family oxidoreductase [Treponema sp.]
MELNLKGKVVVITGGGTGIGKGAALEFAREGCCVAICGRTQQKLVDTKKELEAFGCKTYIEVADVSDISTMESFASNVCKILGTIDCWVNNAAIAFEKKIEDVTENDWDIMNSINLKSVFFCSRIAASHMQAAGKGGVIINVSSIASVVPNPTRAIYAITKIGINSLTRTFAGNYAPYGIRVISVIPGMTETEMNRSLKNIPDNMALMRNAKVEEIAKPIVFLTSDAAGYITGVNIEIAGGKLCIQKPQAAWKAAGKM